MATEPEFKSFSVGPMDNNVYILVDPASRESVLFDAPTDADRILAELEGTHLTYILMTHADTDHVQALEAIKSRTGAPIGAHPDTAWNMPIPPDFEVQDGDVLTVGDVQIEARHTPGHSPGSISYVVGDMVIAGDTLFPGGPGNTRHARGDFDTIINSIRTRLYTLPDETKVYPGHGSPTTIGAERPHLQEWIDRGW